MSVSLTPINELNKARGEDDYPETIGTSNGEWKAVTVACNAFEPDLPVWNGMHDSVRYTPEQLRRMADRIEQMAHMPEDLCWLADNGGAELS